MQMDTKKLTKLGYQNLVVCAWRLDTSVSAETYVDAVDKLVALAKQEVFNDLICIWTEFNKKYKDGNKAYAELGKYIRKSC